MKRIAFLLFVIFATLSMMAQGSGKQTSYKRFISRSGIIIKYEDMNKKKYMNVGTASTFKCCVRMFYGEEKNRYYYIIGLTNLTKLNYCTDDEVAAIEYHDLIEINKAVTRLLYEEPDDLMKKAEHICNFFISNDDFQIGYNINKSDSDWFLVLCKDGKEYPIDNAHKFAQHLRDAQKEIAEIMAKNGK